MTEHWLWFIRAYKMKLTLKAAHSSRSLRQTIRHMKTLLFIAILTAAAPAFSQDESFPVGTIEFYGHTGVDVKVVRDTLPLREGDKLSQASKQRMVARVKRAIRKALGYEPTDVTAVCCDDRGRLIVYIGLPGKWVQQSLYNPSPRGSDRLPSAALKVQRDVEKAWLNAMKKGVSGEDDSKGYALSLDPDARTKQLAQHAYVARNSSMVARVLTSARNVEHRQIAAEMLGYADRSPEQIAALIHASHDVDDGVRNNAIRALVVLARSSSEVPAMIHGECFVGLLNSGIWTDRNKSGELLSVLTAQRDPRLLTCLREQSLTSLIEMARWSNPGHAHAARLMLGRIAGIDETTLIGMIERNEVEPIINAVTTQKNDGAGDGQRCPPCTTLKSIPSSPR